MKTLNGYFKLNARSLTLASVILFSVFAVSCNKSDETFPAMDPAEGTMDLVATLQNVSGNAKFFSEADGTLKAGRKVPTFGILMSALEKTQLTSTVAKSRLTVFAPSDDAFKKLFSDLGIGGIQDLTSEQLKPILLYHVLGSPVFSTQLKAGFVPTLNGAAVEVKLNGGVMINDANVVRADLKALNGALHIIDKVLDLPKNIVQIAQGNPDFSILVEAVVKAGLAETLSTGGPFTVFAPTNTAFQNLFTKLGVSGIQQLTSDQLTPILLYHVLGRPVFSSQLKAGFVPTVNGGAVEVKLNGGVMINDANVISADLNALNGAIHVIDQVLLPPSQNIVEIAQGNPDFSILVEAVVKAGLAETLSTGGPFTVFAPTNDAFGALLDELGYAGLDEIPVEDLKNVLLYHVVSGRVYSSDLPTGPYTVPTALTGKTFEINASTLSILDLNGRQASLVASLLNIQATNGVIHVIGRVILPK